MAVRGGRRLPSSVDMDYTHLNTPPPPPSSLNGCSMPACKRRAPRPEKAHLHFHRSCSATCRPQTCFAPSQKNKNSEWRLCPCPLPFLVGCMRSRPWSRVGRPSFPPQKGGHSPTQPRQALKRNQRLEQWACFGLWGGFKSLVCR